MIFKITFVLLRRDFDTGVDNYLSATEVHWAYQLVPQSPTGLFRGICKYSTPGISVVCYVTVCQPAGRVS